MVNDREGERVDLPSTAPKRDTSDTDTDSPVMRVRRTVVEVEFDGVSVETVESWTVGTRCDSVTVAVTPVSDSGVGHNG